MIDFLFLNYSIPLKLEFIASSFNFKYSNFAITFQNTFHTKITDKMTLKIAF